MSTDGNEGLVPSRCSSDVRMVATLRYLSTVLAEDGEPNAVIAEAANRIEALGKEIKQIHRDYGCEVRDPCGTIWEYCDLMRAKAIDVLEWYYRVGDVGGAVEPMDELCKVVGVTEEWLCRK